MLLAGPLLHRSFLAAAFLAASPAAATVAFEPATTATAPTVAQTHQPGGHRAAVSREVRDLEGPGPAIALVIGITFLGLQVRRRAVVRQVSH
jgi:hypothetical protein